MIPLEDLSIGKRILLAIIIVLAVLLALMALSYVTAEAQMVPEASKGSPPVLILRKLHGPEGQDIFINPAHIVSVRAPRANDTLGPQLHCVLHTTDGKFISVVERCNEFVREVEP